MFSSSIEERRDPFKSWARDDQTFFAAGACHILADLFLQIRSHLGYKMVFIKPENGFSGNHVYASDGEWAFDHNGWTPEKYLLETTERAYRQKHPGWDYQRIVIDFSSLSLEDFCREHNHHLPWQFAYLPWERAYRYLTQFPDTPPC